MQRLLHLPSQHLSNRHQQSRRTSFPHNPNLNLRRRRRHTRLHSSKRRTLLTRSNSNNMGTKLSRVVIRDRFRMWTDSRDKDSVDVLVHSTDRHRYRRKERLYYQRLYQGFQRNRGYVNMLIWLRTSVYLGLISFYRPWLCKSSPCPRNRLRDFRLWKGQVWCNWYASKYHTRVYSGLTMVPSTSACNPRVTHWMSIACKNLAADFLDCTLWPRDSHYHTSPVSIGFLRTDIFLLNAYH